MILIDTNVLARSLERGHIHHDAALASLAHLRKQNQHELIIFPQVLTEFYAIATRGVNSLKLTPDQALVEMGAIEQRFSLLLETPDIFSKWKVLISKYKVANRHVFDLRLVALMVIHSVPQILTFNDEDFASIAEIRALNPFDILNIPRV